MEGLLRIAGVLAGLAITGGAVAAWHFWKMDWLVAFIMAGAGCTIISTALTGKREE